MHTVLKRLHASLLLAEVAEGIELRLRFGEDGMRFGDEAVIGGGGGVCEVFEGDDGVLEGGELLQYAVVCFVEVAGRRGGEGGQVDEGLLETAICFSELVEDRDKHRGSGWAQLHVRSPGVCFSRLPERLLLSTQASPYFDSLYIAPSCSQDAPSPALARAQRPGSPAVRPGGIEGCPWSDGRGGLRHYHADGALIVIAVFPVKR